VPGPARGRRAPARAPAGCRQDADAGRAFSTWAAPPACVAGSPPARATSAAGPTSARWWPASAVASLRKSLVERRDAASGILAFELAAKLQQEIEAVDWVTAEQKVTSPTQADHDICGRATASRHLEQTPPGWVPFAERNADLAARLTGR
jgi:excinuclease ABC subunit C